MRNSNFTALILTVPLSVGLTILLLSIFGFGQPHAANRNTSVYDRVTKTGILRCGYAPWGSSLMIDPNTGAKSGIFVDYLKELTKRLDLKVEWTEEVGWGDIVAGLNSNRFDMFCSDLWANSKRAKEIEFIEPIFYSTLNAYVRPGDTRFDNQIEKVDDPVIKVSALEGEMSNFYPAKNFPKAQIIALPQMSQFSQVITNILDGKADIVFTDTDTADNFLKSNPGKLRQVILKRPLNVFGNVVGLKPGEPRLQQMFNITTIEMMHDGTLDAIIRKYENKPGKFLRVAEPYQTVKP